MSKLKDETFYEVGVSLQILELKQQVEQLNQIVLALLFERDNIFHNECEQIEKNYLRRFGPLEVKAYDLYCRVLRLKRKTELLQMYINRQEAIDITHIEALLDKEFSEYQEKLDDKIAEINSAISYFESEFLTGIELSEFKKLYRQVIKRLHPDLNPHLSEEKKRLFYTAQQAYKNGDLKQMRIIAEMLVEGSISAFNGTEVEYLQTELNRLLEIQQQVLADIEMIKNKYPYTLKIFIEDAQKSYEKTNELKVQIQEFEGLLKMYKKKITEMGGGYYE